MRPLDLSHEKFGRLTPMKPSRTVSGKYAWICKCDCGKYITVRTADLRRGHTQSCGCYQAEQVRTHGLSKTAPYHTWRKMVARCCDETDKDYSNYGARGITVCTDWLDYSKFYEWALQNGYKRGLTIDRIDNDKGYCPSNCRFITMREQERNKTNNIHVTYDGEEMLLVEFAERHNIPYTTVYWRYKHDRDLKTGRCVTHEQV